MDSNYGLEDFEPETLASLAADCAAFQQTYAELLELAYSDPNYHGRDGSSPAAMAGHDFWLTRCGHGAGFWDRGLGDIGEKLSDAAREFGNVDLYVADIGAATGKICA